MRVSFGPENLFFWTKLTFEAFNQAQYNGTEAFNEILKLYNEFVNSQFRHEKISLMLKMLENDKFRGIFYTVIGRDIYKIYIPEIISNT
jgi:hypothetical protein